MLFKSKPVDVGGGVMGRPCKYKFVSKNKPMNDYLSSKVFGALYIGLFLIFIGIGMSQGPIAGSDPNFHTPSSIDR